MIPLFWSCFKAFVGGKLGGKIEALAMKMTRIGNAALTPTSVMIMQTKINNNNSTFMTHYQAVKQLKKGNLHDWTMKFRTNLL